MTVVANGRPGIIIERNGDRLTIIRADHDLEQVPAASVQLRDEPLPLPLQNLTRFFGRPKLPLARGASVEFLQDGRLSHGVVCRRLWDGIEIATRSLRLTIEDAFIRHGPSLDAGPGAPSPMDHWSVKLQASAHPFSLEIDAFTGTLYLDEVALLTASNDGTGEPNAYTRISRAGSIKQLHADAQAWLEANGVTQALYAPADLWVLYETSARHLGIDAPEFLRRFDASPSPGHQPVGR